LTFLENLAEDQPTGSAASVELNAEAPQARSANDGSLGIGSLKGETRHE